MSVNFTLYKVKRYRSYRLPLIKTNWMPFSPSRSGYQFYQARGQHCFMDCLAFENRRYTFDISGCLEKLSHVTYGVIVFWLLHVQCTCKISSTSRFHTASWRLPPGLHGEKSTTWVYFGRVILVSSHWFLEYFCTGLRKRKNKITLWCEITPLMQNAFEYFYNHGVTVSFLDFRTSSMGRKITPLAYFYTN